VWANKERLDELEAIARRGAEMALEMRGNLQVELKPDGSVVTSADRAVERMVRERLAELDPKASIIGEEGGRDTKGDERLYAIDPIDGTSNYAYGLPLWGVSIGLLEDGVATAGVIALPDLAQVYTGLKGSGAFLNGQRLPQVRPGPIEPHEIVSNGDPRVDDGCNDKVPGKTRCLGAFVAEAAFAAAGQCRAMTTTGPKIWDVAASLAICREVGLEAHLFETGEPVDEGVWQESVKCQAFGIAPPHSNLPYGKLR
jgi:myo-inositol-1(or 4)-monophosphatase